MSDSSITVVVYNSKNVHQYAAHPLVVSESTGAGAIDYAAACGFKTTKHFERVHRSPRAVCEGRWVELWGKTFGVESALNASILDRLGVRVYGKCVFVARDEGGGGVIESLGIDEARALLQLDENIAINEEKATVAKGNKKANAKAEEKVDSNVDLSPDDSCPKPCTKTKAKSKAKSKAKAKVESSTSKCDNGAPSTGEIGASSPCDSVEDNEPKDADRSNEDNSDADEGDQTEDNAFCDEGADADNADEDAEEDVEDAEEDADEEDVEEEIVEDEEDADEHDNDVEDVEEDADEIDEPEADDDDENVMWLRKKKKNAPKDSVVFGVIEIDDIVVDKPIAEAELETEEYAPYSDSE